MRIGYRTTTARTLSLLVLSLTVNSVPAVIAEQFGTPKESEGTRIFQPTEHPYYSGQFHLSSQKAINLKQWHTLRITHQGCRVKIFYDDKQTIDLCEDTFHTGLIGLWTKSDAVTYFDDLQVQQLK